MKAAIIGAGEIGRAIGHLLEVNGVEHGFWDKDPARATGKLDVVLSSADMVFFCVPSWALREALLSVKEIISEGEIGVFVSKGLEPGTDMIAPEIALDVIPGMRTVFVGGPMIAEEVSSGKGGAAVIASADTKAAQVVCSALSSSEFFCARSSDISGTAFAGVLKNIYALVMGAAEGSGKGVNAKGILVSGSVEEMGRVITRLGGRAEASHSLAGLGDLIATGSGALSSNWSAGWALAKGETPEKNSEGMSSFPGLLRRLNDNISDFGILRAAGDLIGGLDPKEVFGKISVNS